MRGRRHDDATRAAVVAALLAGQGVSDVAREYELPIRTVQEWKDAVGEEFAAVRQLKQADYGALVGSYLATLLTTLKVQAEFFGREDWLAKQEAHDLAVLHGICTDKAIRLLEAAERAALARGEAQNGAAAHGMARDRLPPTLLELAIPGGDPDGP